MFREWFFVAVLALCSCAPHKASSSAVPAPPSSEPTKQSCTPFEISKDGVVGISVDTTCVVRLSGNQVGKLTEDHRLVDIHDTTTASLTGQGLLVDAAGKPLVGLDESGRLDNGSGVVIHWSPEGHLLRGEEDVSFTVAPNDPAVYRPASMLLFLYLSVQ